MEILLFVFLPALFSIAISILRNASQYLYWGSFFVFIAIALLIGYFRSSPGAPNVNHPLYLAGFFVVVPLMLSFIICRMSFFERLPALMVVICAIVIFFVGAQLGLWLGMGLGLLIP